MKNTRASTTAERIAFVRAPESSRPAGERICYDPLARKLISPAFYPVDQTLRFVLENSGSGSSIIFDDVYASALTAVYKRAEITRMQRAKRYTGEGLVFGIEEGHVEEFLLARGYTQVQNVTSQDLERMYFTGVNEARVIASTYAIAHAVVRK
jgi:O-methyltransferase involved in polyketide biosynthesis